MIIRMAAAADAEINVGTLSLDTNSNRNLSCPLPDSYTYEVWTGYLNMEKGVVNGSGTGQGDYVYLMTDPSKDRVTEVNPALAGNSIHEVLEQMREAGVLLIPPGRVVETMIVENNQQTVSNTYELLSEGAIQVTYQNVDQVARGPIPLGYLKPGLGYYIPSDTSGSATPSSSDGQGYFSGGLPGGLPRTTTDSANTSWPIGGGNTPGINVIPINPQFWAGPAPAWGSATAVPGPYPRMNSQVYGSVNSGYVGLLDNYLAHFPYVPLTPLPLPLFGASPGETMPLYSGLTPHSLPAPVQIQYFNLDSVGNILNSPVLYPSPSVQSLSVKDGGTGYTDPSASNVATTGGSGTGLTLTYNTVGNVITNVTVVTPGTGYKVGDVLTVTGGGGDATVTVVVPQNLQFGQIKVTLVCIKMAANVDNQPLQGQNLPF